ncbi:lycopene cyclase domain-containing protein [Natronosporangium hydrolyticum]|uniref:Lycopene cyclase domain-containing protein n=1 Tax=Natronosporangium hydrolyticum TaxID=2811111 RepID=A0A895YED4_9ACTN|nr:lycopene cyclase domain-containing protein [Natronosporangium hydrolyticum]QSB13793.1 lycopene cyclase domain-containing protein [Natronosporangium hydrolyticum]
MPDLPLYTVAAVAAPLLVVALELLVLRTGLFRTLRYWLTMLIVLGFQIPVDGWLTKPQGTVVLYDEAQILGIRAPVSFPIEDFGFGFAMVTLTVLLWRWLRNREQRRPAPPAAAQQSPARTAEQASA